MLTLLTMLVALLSDSRLFDLFSALLRLVSVRLFVFNNKKTWIVSNINILTNLYNLYSMGFVLKVATKIGQICMQVYAWYFWRNQDETQTTTISYLEPIEYLITATFTISLTCLLFIIKTSYLHAEPYAIDTWLEIAMITLNYTALTLSIRRKMECWAVWILYNTISSFAYYDHGLPFNALGSIIMFGIAIEGFTRWTNIYQEEQSYTETIEKPVYRT